MRSKANFTNTDLHACYRVTTATKLILGHFASIRCVWRNLFSSKFADPANNEWAKSISSVFPPLTCQREMRSVASSLQSFSKRFCWYMSAIIHCTYAHDYFTACLIKTS
jgi:hypothetical protein